MDESPAVPPATGAQEEPETRNWTPMIVGAVVVVLIVGIFLILAILGRSRRESGVDPYLAKVQISNLHMARAQNFAGGSVTYIEGTISNTGDKKVNAANVQVVFKNYLGEISQRETIPVAVVAPNTPYLDYGPLSRTPLAPGQSRDFRLTLEYVTTDWDGQAPTVSVVSVKY